MNGYDSWRGLAVKGKEKPEEWAEDTMESFIFIFVVVVVVGKREEL